MPLALRRRVICRYMRAGNLPSRFQLLTADGPTPAERASAQVPPSALTILATCFWRNFDMKKSPDPVAVWEGTGLFPVTQNPYKESQLASAYV
jgi:hypothetical protein